MPAHEPGQPAERIVLVNWSAAISDVAMYIKERGPPATCLCEEVSILTRLTVSRLFSASSEGKIEEEVEGAHEEEEVVVELQLGEAVRR